MDNEFNDQFNEGYGESDLSLCLKADTIKRGIIEKLELRLQMVNDDIVQVVNNKNPEDNDKVVQGSVDRGERDRIDLENQLEKLAELKYRCKVQTAKDYIQTIYNKVKTITYNGR